MALPHPCFAAAAKQTITMSEESNEGSGPVPAHPAAAQRKEIRERLGQVSARMSQLPAPEFTVTPPDEYQEFRLERLTKAVWVLAALVAVNLAVTLLLVVYPMFMAGGFVMRAPAVAFSGGPSTFSPARDFDVTYDRDELNGFHDWPIEKRIEMASVIAIARHVTEGSRVKAIISEILKQKPGARFYYKVGDEYAPGGHFLKEGTHYGDGQLIFFTGSPASMRYSVTFTGDRIGGMGDMPLEMLREMARTNQPAGRK